MPTTDDYDLKWGKVRESELTEFLVKEHDFSEDRVKSKLDSLMKKKEDQKQTGLGSFF